MVAFTVQDTPGETSKARVAARRVWRSRVIMTVFYLVTLATLMVVSGIGAEETRSDPITEAARRSVPVLADSGIDLVERD